MNWSNWLIAIPARMNSQRLPGKALADLGGKPMIVRVAERLNIFAKKGALVIVGTDHPDIIKACNTHGIDARLTSETHQSGTDRIFELAQENQRPFVLNVQGDEPFVSLSDLEHLTQNFMQLPKPQMGTLVVRNHSFEDFNNPNIVKALITGNNARYFSRAPIPYYRDTQSFNGFWQHQGVYAYRFETLSDFCSMQPSLLEKIEHLEQLRAIENQIEISTVEAKHRSLGIDTPEDLEAARAKFIM